MFPWRFSQFISRLRNLVWFCFLSSCSDNKQFSVWILEDLLHRSCPDWLHLFELLARSWTLFSIAPLGLHSTRFQNSSQAHPKVSDFFFLHPLFVCLTLALFFHPHLVKIRFLKKALVSIIVPLMWLINQAINVFILIVPFQWNTAYTH